MSNTEPTEVKNKFKFGGVEYKFATDTTAEEGSANFITSGAVAAQLARCIPEGVTDTISDGNASVPTSQSVWTKYKDVIYYDAGNNKFYYYANGVTKTYINSINITITS